MVDWLETPGFGDRAHRDGDATHVPPDAEARMRAAEESYARFARAQLDASAEEVRYRAAAEARADDWWTKQEALRAGATGALREQADGDVEYWLFTSPMWAVLTTGAVAALFVTLFLGMLMLAGVGDLDWLAVTAPLWGSALFGALVAVGMGAACAVLDAYDVHRRRTRRP